MLVPASVPSAVAPWTAEHSGTVRDDADCHMLITTNSPPAAHLGAGLIDVAAVAGQQEAVQQQVSKVNPDNSPQVLTGSSDGLQHLLVGLAAPACEADCHPPSRSCSSTHLAAATSASSPVLQLHLQQALQGSNLAGSHHPPSVVHESSTAVDPRCKDLQGRAQSFMPSSPDVAAAAVLTGSGAAATGLFCSKAPASTVPTAIHPAPAPVFGASGHEQSQAASLLQSLVQPEVVVVVTQERAKVPAIEQLLALLAAPLPAGTARKPAEAYREVSTFTSKGRQAVSAAKVMCRMGALGLRESALARCPRLFATATGGVSGPGSADGGVALQQQAALMADLQLLLSHLARSIRCSVDVGRVVIVLHVPGVDAVVPEEPGLVIATTAGSLHDATTVVKSLVDQLAVLYD